MKADFNWDDTRIFLAVARSGTLSGAAETMDMGIATLSRRLDRLEKSLAVPLFSRHQSGYRLTDDGEALLARAEALEHAGLAFGETARLQGNVADLAIRMVKPESGNLTLKRLGKVGFGLYSADTGLEGSTDVAFNHAQYIGWPESHQHLPAARWITRTLRGRPCRVEANTLLAQLSAVSAGLGLGVLPHFMTRKNGLQCVNADIGVDQTLWLVMHSDLAHSRRVRVVADHLIALFDEIKDQLTSP